NYSYCEKIGIAPCLRRAEMPVRLGLRKDLGHDSACPSTFRYKSGRGGWIWRTWFRHSRARLDFGRAHYIRNRDFRANFQIGRTFCRGRIDINFEFLRPLLHCHHAARGGYHRPSDLISLRTGGECYPTEDQIRYRDQAKCHFHFHVVNYEPAKARRKILEDIDLRDTRASFRFNDVTLLTIQRDVSHSFGGSGIALTPTGARYSSAPLSCQAKSRHLSIFPSKALAS